MADPLEELPVAENDDDSIRASVRNTFLQLFRRINARREQENDATHQAVESYLQYADQIRLESLGIARNEKCLSWSPSKRRRILTQGSNWAPWISLNGAVFCCSACKTSICRPADLIETENGLPKIFLDDSNGNDVIASKANIEMGKWLTFSPKTHVNWSYRASMVYCPDKSCKRALGLRLGWIAFKEGHEHERNTNYIDRCRFPCIIRRTALFQSPRLHRPSPEFMSQQQVARQNGAFEVNVDVFFFVGRYLNICDANTRFQLPQLPKRSEAFVRCGNNAEGVLCNAPLSDVFQILSTKHTWKMDDLIEMNAFKVNSLQASCHELGDPRLYSLQDGPVMIREISCCKCKAIVGFLISSDRSECNQHEHEVGRCFLLSSRTIVS